MRLDAWTLALQAINALVLIWLLSRFLFRPVADFIAARQKAAHALLADAERLKLEAQAQLQASTAERAQLAAARDAVMQAAAEAAQAERAARLAASQVEAEALKQGARDEIARWQEAAARAASEHSARLAVDIAGKLLQRLPAGARVDGFIDGIASGIASLPAASRAARPLEDGAAPLHLAVPRPLTPAEDAACRAALARAFGMPVEIETEVDPSLIAGLELKLPDAVVRNSLRDDLSQILHALREDAATSVAGAAAAGPKEPDEPDQSNQLARA